MTNILFKEESFKIVGICMNIHSVLGMGLKEINYQDAMEIEFIDNNIPYKREQRFKVIYKNKILRSPYIADFVLFDKIIIEVKSAASIIDAHLAQTLSYLKVSNMKLGIIVNFGEKSLRYKRVVA
jgi:GxxExxY protein